jgi:peptide/nickel transport system permease protein
MTKYIILRLLQGLLVLILVTIYIFLVMRLLPGDPLILYIGKSEMGDISPEDMAALKHQYGLDKSLPLQYIDWVSGILHGDFGDSIFMKEKVSTLFAQRLPVTLHIGILSIIFSSILGIAFGVICAIRWGKPIDAILTVLANIGITAPQFWVGIILIYLLAFKAQVLPVYGYTSPFDDFWESTRQLVLPVFCLSLFSIASLTRLARSSTLEVIRQDYVRTAWAKGLREWVIITKHVLKNSLIPVVTMLGMQMGMIFGGSVLIESVFNIPGMGRLMRDAVFSQDYPVIQFGVIIIATVIILSNLIVDISYSWFDPRIRYD